MSRLVRQTSPALVRKSPIGRSPIARSENSLAKFAPKLRKLELKPIRSIASCQWSSRPVAPSG